MATTHDLAALDEEIAECDRREAEAGLLAESLDTMTTSDAFAALMALSPTP